MPTSTTNLSLYKYDTTTDGDLTFNFNDSLNDNWDKIDTAYKGLSDEKADASTVNSALALKADASTVNSALALKADKTTLHALKAYSDNGELLTDEEGLADVTKYAHSTFDLSKFTVVGSPNITNGVLSKTAGASASTSDYVTFPFDPTATSWKIIGQFDIKTFATSRLIGDPGSAIQVYLGSSGINLNVYNSGTSTNVISPVAFPAGGNTGTFDIYIQYNSGTYEIGWKRDTDPVWKTGSGQNAVVPDNSVVSILKEVAANGSFSFDLKKLEYYKNGNLTFNGNATGIDTYTIGGNTVTIPYNISSRGLKIAPASARTNITALAATQGGYAPYFTLDEINGDFTLPMGDLYSAFEPKNKWVYADQTNAISTATAIGTYDLTSAVTSVLPVNSDNYECLFRYNISRKQAGGSTNTNYTVTVSSNIVLKEVIDSAATSGGADTNDHCGQFTAIIDKTRAISLEIDSQALNSSDLYLVAYRKVN